MPTLNPQLSASRRLVRLVLSLLSSLLCAGLTAGAQPRILDSFERLEGWTAIPSDGTAGAVTSAPGVRGSAMAIDYSFRAGSGYVIAQKPFPLELAANYRFAFYLRGEGPVNNFEFKLLDTAGNVYWVKTLNVDFPRAWKRSSVKRRHITFAWGPARGGEIRSVDRIEFVVSAGTGGGEGRIFIDEFTYEPIDDRGIAPAPVVKVSSGKAPGFAAGNLDSFLVWKPGGVKPAWMTVEFGRTRELGGLVLDWGREAHAADYDVEISDDAGAWTTGSTVRGGNGGRDYVYLPETDTRSIRLKLLRPAAGRYALNAMSVKGPEFGSSPNALYATVSADGPRGWFPKYFGGVQSYWTVIGAAGDAREAMINEEGMIEVDRGSLSLEPFVYADGKLATWSDATCEQSLDGGYLPIPSVVRTGDGISVEIRAFAAGEAGSSVLFATYTVANTGPRSASGNLYVALRPFQVNPPTQWLNIVGGVSSITAIAYARGVVEINGTKRVVPLGGADGFGATSFGGGDIIEYLAKNTLPAQTTVSEPLGFASGALRFGFRLGPGERREVTIAVPFHDAATVLPAGVSREETPRLVASRLERTREFWQSKLDRISFRLPPEAKPVEQTLKSNLAYIFINRDGPAIQPGSRSYERAWIRDGSLTSSALLRTGNAKEVREYIDWYARYQYPSGKIPCVVDSRGADPVPEHDSHGQFIFAVMEYFRFTRDTAWLRGKYGQVQRTVRYIQELRAQRKTEAYRTGDPIQRACYGLVPESISHEGYSEKPMHSYWDNFFVLRGLKDAAEMARVLDDSARAAEYIAERDDARAALYASMRLSMETHGVDYIPGCAELGDFDATSTTIGVYPCGELGWIPEPQLHSTFDRYYSFFKERRDGGLPWRNYTPYEVRIIGTYVYLDQKARAHELLDFFMRDRRPPGWNHWAEVVWNGREAPGFIGDMPHTWVGSDFIRSIRSMFAYERESDAALVIGAGIPESWIASGEGVGVSALPTYYGPLTYSVHRTSGGASVDVRGPIDMPPGGIEVRAPLDHVPSSALVNGAPASIGRAGSVRVTALPALIVFTR